MTIGARVPMVDAQQLVTALAPNDGSITIGIDIGGTFVDAVVAVAGAPIGAAKAPSTPADPVVGVLDAIDAVAVTVGVQVAHLLARTTAIVHGTTVGLNALLTRTGAEVGLLTTLGHEDAILIGRVHQKVAGLGPEAMIRVAELSKPEPIVPRWRIVGIDERIDAAGRVVAPLDGEGVARAADALVEDGCESIAISFLWSFRNPDHERRAHDIVRERHADIPISLSSAVAPVIGEYERTAATVVNAYLRRSQTEYVDRLVATLHARGFRGALRMLLSSGGTANAQTVADRPVETLRSGPVGGAIAVARLGRQIGARDLLATDMGGTSFDVALVLDGRPDVTNMALVGQLHLAASTVDIASIGAGGGSVAWTDPDGGLHVGPRSAGSDPGPACYGRGGSEATVTDADLVLGRLDPGARLGGRIKLDERAARRAIEPLAAALGVDVVAAAAGVIRIADAKMADLVRQVTIERGHDPRRLVLVAYGGAAGLHAGAYGFEAGASEVVLPRHASTLSAVGLATADPQRAYRRSGPAVVPLDPEEIAKVFAEMERHARSDLRDARRDGRGRASIQIRREIGFRYRRQTHEVVVTLSAAAVTAARLERSVARFEKAYERIHGPGTGFRAAGIEATSFTVVASVPGQGRGAALPARPVRERTPRAHARRTVWFDGWPGATNVFDGQGLRSGDAAVGPAVIEWPTTSVLVHPGQRVTIDQFGHLHLRAGS